MKKLVFCLLFAFCVPSFAQNAALLEKIKTYPPEMQPDMKVQALAAPLTVTRYVTGQGYREVTLPVGTEIITLLGKPYADTNGFLRQNPGYDELVAHVNQGLDDYKRREGAKDGACHLRPHGTSDRPSTAFGTMPTASTAITAGRNSSAWASELARSSDLPAQRTSRRSVHRRQALHRPL